MPEASNALLATGNADYLKGHADGMRLQARSIDCTLELRHGEYPVFIEGVADDLLDGEFVVGGFVIPTPGRMNLSSDTHEPAEAFTLVLARKIAGRFTWVKPGMGTHRKLTEDFVSAGMAKGAWHTMRLITSLPLDPTIPDVHARS